METDEVRKKKKKRENKEKLYDEKTARAICIWNLFLYDLGMEMKGMRSFALYAII